MVRDGTRTHFEAAVDDSNQGAGDVESPLDLSDGALHVGSTEGFCKIYERQRNQEELENTDTSLEHLYFWVLDKQKITTVCSEDKSAYFPAST